MAYAFDFLMILVFFGHSEQGRSDPMYGCNRDDSVDATRRMGRVHVTWVRFPRTGIPENPGKYFIGMAARNRRFVPPIPDSFRGNVGKWLF